MNFLDCTVVKLIHTLLYERGIYTKVSNLNSYSNALDFITLHLIGSRQNLATEYHVGNSFTPLITQHFVG